MSSFRRMEISLSLAIISLPSGLNTGVSSAQLYRYLPLLNADPFFLRSGSEVCRQYRTFRLPYMQLYLCRLQIPPSESSDDDEEYYPQYKHGFLLPFQNSHRSNRSPDHSQTQVSGLKTADRSEKPSLHEGIRRILREQGT